MTVKNLTKEKNKSRFIQIKEAGNILIDVKENVLTILKFGSKEMMAMSLTCKLDP